MRWWVARVCALMGIVALSGCKDDPECVAHVECGTLRCVAGTCQSLEGEPEAPEPEGPMPEGEPETPEPEGPMPEGQPEPEAPPGDMGRPGPDDGVEPEPQPDMGPPPGPDRQLFEQTIQGILLGQCSSCHPGPATPGDGRYNTEGAMFGNLYEEVQEFLNLQLPAQSRLIELPAGAAQHQVIWARDSPDYQQVLRWIETGRQ